MSFLGKPNASQQALVPHQTEFPTRKSTELIRVPVTKARPLPALAYYAQRLVPITLTAGATTIAAVRLMHTIWRLVKPLRSSDSKELNEVTPIVVISECFVQQNPSGVKWMTRQIVINQRKR